MTLRVHETCTDWFNQTVEFAKKIGLYEPVPEVGQVWVDGDGAAAKIVSLSDEKIDVSILPTRGITGLTREEFLKNYTLRGGKNYLKTWLNYLDTYADKKREGQTECVLYRDFAPASFEFVMYKKNDKGEYRWWFNGGLLYHGPHDAFGSGSGPTFAVTLEPTTGWSVHT